MKKILFLLLVTFFVSGVSQAIAYDYGVAEGDKIKWDGSYSGGAFSLESQGSADKYKWSTFCVEHTKPIYNNTWMTVAKIGDTNSTNTGSLFGNSVAWLYWNFNQGTLAGDLSNTNVQKDLQYVIWNQLGQAHEAYAFYDSGLVEQWLNSALSDTLWTNNGRVQILQLTSQNGKIDYQDVLIAGTGGTNPVPEPTTMALLGIGLLGLVAVGRKKATQN